MTTVSRVPSVLPWEDGTLQVWHHAEMTTISRADTSYVIVRSVRISGITSVVVFSDNIVLALSLRQRELTLSVSYPQTELVAAQRTEECSN